jgi:hypothetical protein
MSQIEVHIISNRLELDKFINMWDTVKTEGSTTIKVLTVNYSEKKFTLKNGINVEYIKQKTFPRTTFMNQAWARNELLCHSRSEYVLFFDDWQRPDNQILVEHLRYLKSGLAVCGRRQECNKDGLNCKEDGRTVSGSKIGTGAICHYGNYWTCNASVRLDNTISVNGFDNRFNGGTGGEDYDFAMRLTRLGTRIVYNTSATAYHYCHDHLVNIGKSGRKGSSTHGHTHNVGAYKYLPEYGHRGDWNLNSSDKYELWWEGPIKYFRCKDCKEMGILDSMQVYNYNRDNNVVRVENGLEQVRNALKKAVI